MTTTKTLASLQRAIARLTIKRDNAQAAAASLSAEILTLQTEAAQRLGIALPCAPTAHVVTATATPRKPTQPERVRATVCDGTGRCFRVSDIVRATGISGTGVQVALSHLVATGEIERPSVGLYRAPIASLR